MGDKKSHEVERLAALIANFANQQNIHQMIDVGSGRGYLGSMLALYYSINVLGLDNVDNLTASAQKRQKNVEKHWNGVLKRLKHDSQQTNNKTIEGNYRSVTSLVNHETDFDAIASKFEIQKRFGICGLHTCGDLAFHTLDAFSRSDQAKFLCLVGCCYHLIEEEFAENPFRKSDLPLPSYGFPLSSVLKTKKFGISRNARVLAAQSVYRISELNKIPPKSLFWRAVFQQIIWDKYRKTEILEFKTGPISKKCQNFVQYCYMAIEKLHLPIKISEEEILEYEKKFGEFERKIGAFFQYRCTLAPCIEAAIVIDRLLYLIERGINAFVISLFDPATSPRCYCIVAIK